MTPLIKISYAKLRAMKKAKKTVQKPASIYPILIVLLAFVVGIVIGYVLSSNKRSKTPYHMDKQGYLKEISKKKCSALTITTPESGAQVTDPVTVTVVVDNTNPKCGWTVFEAQAGSMELRDETDQLIGTGILTTTDDWMTNQPVTYTGTIPFMNVPASANLVLTIFEEDPSGQGSQEVILPLTY